MAAKTKRRFPIASVRARIMAVAVLVIGLALVACAVSLVVLVRQSLIGNVDEAAEILADEMGARAQAGTLPVRLTTSGGPDDDDLLIQVVDARGRVIAASENYEGRPPVSSERPPVEDERRKTLDSLPIDRNDAFRLLAVSYETPQGVVTVYVASELENVKETVATIKRAVRYGAPALLALAGVLIWVLVGRALRPVESIRSQVADISSTALDRRVPEPPVNDEIGRLARTMNAMLDRLQTSAERQRRFVADASHELRSPLAASRTTLEVALSSPSAWDATAADLLAENQRMERLVTDLLFLARSDEGWGDLAPSPVDLDDIVLSEVNRLRAAGEDRIDISRVSAGRVAGRSEHLERVVRNLLENAQHHAQGLVAVELGGAGREVELAVSDDGDGVAAEFRERIFDRFVRLDQARSRDGGGAGLGLAIAREIVRDHGGRIWVEDGPAGGARFVVRLPSP